VGSYKVVTHNADGIHVTLMMIDFANLATYKDWASGRQSLQEAVSDLGDEAFLGPKGSPEPTILCFRNGSRAVRIAAAPAGEGIGEEQLRQLATLILSRM
jgi:hypothetical protein